MKYLLPLLIVLATQCLALPPEDEIQRDKAERFQHWLNEASQFVLVCVYKEGDIKNQRFDGEATVVQSIKGNWKVGDRIHYYIILDEDPGILHLRSELGRLEYMRFDKYSTKPVLLDTGEELDYEPYRDAVVKQFLDRAKHTDSEH